MSHKVKQKQENRRRELLEIALKLFMEVGYEKASIRSLASRAGGDIGLIYHYFSSKSEIYEAALTYYNDRYIEEIVLIFNNSSLGFDKKIENLFLALNTSLSRYKPMIDEANKEIALTLLVRSLETLSPYFDDLIRIFLSNEGIELSDSERILKSNYMLYGCSGIIHAPINQPMATRYETCQRLIFDTLEMIMKNHCN